MIELASFNGRLWKKYFFDMSYFQVLQSLMVWFLFTSHSSGGCSSHGIDKLSSQRSKRIDYIT